MKHEALRPPHEQEFHGVKVGEYKTDTEVVVNIKGDWVKGKLTENAELRGDTLRLVVEHAGASVPGVSEEIFVSEAPKILKYGGSTPTVIDSKFGNHTVSDAHITEAGHIEYTVTDTVKNEKTVGVPQEFIDLWKENVELEKRLETLQTEMFGLGSSKELELMDRNKKIQEKVAEIFATLPDVAKMNKRDRQQIEKLQTDLGALLKEAGDLLKTLEKDVADIKGATPPPPVDKYHLRTSKEKEQDRKEQEKLKKHAEMIRAQIDKALAIRLAEIDEKQKDALDKKIIKAQKAHTKATADWTALSPQEKKNNPNPGKFEPKSIELTRAEIKGFEEQKNKAKQDVYATYLKNSLANPLDQKIIDSVVDKRKEKAKSDRFADPTKDLKTSGSSPQVEDYINTSPKYGEANVEILDKVLADIVVGAVEEEKVPEGKEAFDFDAKYTELNTRIETLIASISKDSTETFDVNARKELEEKRKELEEKYGKLLTLEKAQTDDSSCDNQDKLHIKREKLITDITEVVDTIELFKKQEDAKKEISTHAKDKENNETDAEPVIDIPEFLMRELLKTREAEVKSAVKSLFEGGVVEDGSVNTVSLDAFKTIFDSTAPNGAIMEKLRDCGIKDWEYFKKLWDEKLASNSLLAMNEMAKALVHRNVAENITWRDKLNAQVGQIAFRMLSTAVLVGGVAIGVSALASGIGIFGAAAGTVGALVGGTGGGALRGALNKYVFERPWMKKRQKDIQAKLEDSKRDSVVAGLTDQIMAGITETERRNTDKTKIEGLPSLTGILSQTIRDITTEINKEKFINTETDEELKGALQKLDSNGRILYERALAHLETTNPEAEQKKQLADAISKMNGNGDAKFDAIKDSVDSKIMGVLEKTMAVYSGKSGIKKSAAMGGLVAGAFLVSHKWAEAGGIDWARVAMGGVFGGIKGYQEGRAQDLRAEQREARKNVYTDIKELRVSATDALRDGTVLLPETKKRLQEPLLRLKRLLHVNITDPHELAVYGIASQAKETGDMLDHAGNVVVRNNGEIINPELRALMQDLRATVTDAERAGILDEKKEDRMKMDKVLEAMKAHGDAIAKTQEKNMSEKALSLLKRNWRRVVGSVLGAAGGALTALAVGEMVQSVKQDLGFNKSGGMIDTSEIVKPINAEGARLSAEEHAQRIESRGGRLDTEDSSDRTGRRGLEELPIPEELPVSNLDTFFEKHPTISDSGKAYLTKLTDEYPSLKNHPESLERIYNAGGRGDSSLDGMGDKKWFLQMVRESDTVKFEEILKHGGSADAVKYLESLGLNKHSLSLMGIKGGASLEEFAQGYKTHVLDNPGTKDATAWTKKMMAGMEHNGMRKTLSWKDEAGGKLYGAGKRLSFGKDAVFLGVDEQGQPVVEHTDKTYYYKPSEAVVQSEEATHATTDDTEVSSDNVVRQGFAHATTMNIDSQTIEGIIKNIHQIKGNADVFDVKELSSNKAVVEFSDGTTYEVYKDRGDRGEYRGKYIQDTRLQTNVNKLIQVIPGSDENTRLSNADRIMAELQKRHGPGVVIDQASVGSNGKLDLTMTYPAEKGITLESGQEWKDIPHFTRTEKMSVQDLVRTSTRDMIMTPIGGKIHDMFVRPGDVLSSTSSEDGSSTTKQVAIVGRRGAEGAETQAHDVSRKGAEVPGETMPYLDIDDTRVSAIWELLGKNDGSYSSAPPIEKARIANMAVLLKWQADLTQNVDSLGTMLDIGSADEVGRVWLDNKGKQFADNAQKAFSTLEQGIREGKSIADIQTAITATVSSDNKVYIDKFVGKLVDGKGDDGPMLLSQNNTITPNPHTTFLNRLNTDVLRKDLEDFRRDVQVTQAVSTSTSE
ncbi:MAG: hypothetical protein HYV41_04745 [Candidatus Magasanikbacteria bacterium]|nr:hypothetical protein [Candidatus Magasanikbacteria bacterium]